MAVQFKWEKEKDKTYMVQIGYKLDTICNDMRMRVSVSTNLLVSIWFCLLQFKAGALALRTQHENEKWLSESY